MERTSEQSASEAKEPKSVKALLILQILVNPFPRIEEFTALQFKEGVDKISGVNIAYVSPGFFRHYATKVESMPRAQSLYGYKMLLDKSNEEVLKIFGGSENATANLYGIWEKLKRQPDGQGGDLLIDGRVNTFFVPDVEGVVYPVHVRYLGGWHIFMNPNEKNRCCLESTHVFSYEMIA